MAVCPACGTENPESAKFCNECGAALGEAPPALEERKVVTVLFCDLVGFTAASEQADPEDVRSRIRPYHARLRPAAGGADLVSGLPSQVRSALALDDPPLAQRDRKSTRLNSSHVSLPRMPSSA